MGTRILGIDPGLRACGIASFDGETWTAGTIRPKEHDLKAKLLEICYQIKKDPLWDVIVIERPQVYQGHLQKGDPNDLISLGILVGALVIHLPSRMTLLPTPAQWKGQVRKEIHHPRILAKVPGLGRCSKDALDAVGLCLYGVDYARSQKK